MIKLRYFSLKELRWTGTVEELVFQYIEPNTDHIDTFIVDDRATEGENGDIDGPVLVYWWRYDSAGSHLTLIGTNNSGTSTSDTWRPIKSGTVTINATSPLEFLPGDNISLDFTADGKLTINSSYINTTYDIVNFTTSGIVPAASSNSFLSADGDNVAWRIITKISGGKARGNVWGKITD